MSIYRYLDYRLAIQEIFEKHKMVDRTLTYQRVAESMHLQKSYLSQVLKGRADLNQDQLFLFCRFFQINSEESDYLQLLLEHSRSGLKDRRQKLNEKINQARKEHQKSERHISSNLMSTSQTAANEYYMDCLNQLIHVALSIEKNRRRLDLLAPSLQISQKRVSDALATLQRLGFIEISKDGVQVLINNLHLPKDSPMYPLWQSQMRTLVQAHAAQRDRAKSYNFSVFFSADEETRSHIHEQFLDLLAKIQPKVKESPAKGLYQMNFDLLEWIESDG